MLPVRDGHIILAVGNDGQFRKFCAVVGLDALPDNPDFATNAARVTNRKALREALIARLAAFERDALLAELEKAGVPASPINNIGQMFADPQTIARGMRMDLDDGHGNALPSVRAPMLMSKTPLAYERPSPRLGEHTAEILAELEKHERMRTGGQLIVDALEANGVERLYCVPGESFLAVLDALHDSPIRPSSAARKAAPR